MSVKFQAIDWRTDHILFNIEDEEYKKEFIIQIFGRTLDNKTVFVIVTNFEPGFYIKYNDYLNYKSLIEQNKFYNSIIVCHPFKSKEFYGFHGEEKETFIKIKSKKYYILKKFERFFQNNNIKTYESNKDPIIQFIHENNLQTCGWIEVSDYLYNSNDEPEYFEEIGQSTNSDIEIIVDYHNIKPVEDKELQDKILPFTIGAMDIECISEDDQFPQAHRITDEIVSIATTFSRVGENECYRKVALCTRHKESNKEIDKLRLKINKINTLKNLINDEFSTKNKQTIKSYIKSEFIEQIEQILQQKYFKQKINITKENYKDVIKLINSKINEFKNNIKEIQKTLKWVTCPDIDGVEVINCKNEAELILKWCELIKSENPDILTNWNGFMFDDNYIHERAILLGIEDKIKMSRINNEETPFVEKKLSSAQMGDQIMHYYDMRGRVNFDLMKFIRREHNLSSYKLDYVSQWFFREQLQEINNIIEKDSSTQEDIKETIKKSFKIHQESISKTEIQHFYNIDNISNLSIDLQNKVMESIKQFNNIKEKTLLKIKTKEFFKGQYIIIVRNDGVTDYEIENNKKFQILDIIDDMHMIINSYLDNSLLDLKGKILCCHVKDDVPPKEIFNKYRSGNPQEFAELMKYNVQDCNLCNKIIAKLNILVNNIGMAKVCYVPLNWIFNRGQSVKVYSLVSKHCKEQGYKIETYNKYDMSKEVILNKKEEEAEKNKYEGAIVFEPKPDIYDCVFTLDYASLYPTSMLCRNISHETYTKDLAMIEKYKDKYDFFPITYEPLDKEVAARKSKKSKTKVYNNEKITDFIDGYKQKEEQNKNITCYFARDKDRTKIGLIPGVLKDLLACRKKVRREQAEWEKKGESFKAAVCNGLQLAYKITCNSVYGQLGCSRKVGPISLIDLAACTTATGRYMVLRAKEFAEILYPSIVDTALGKYNKKLLKEFKKLVKPILKEDKTLEHKFLKLCTDDIIVKSKEKRYNNMKKLMDWYLNYYDNENGVNQNMQNPENRKKLYDKIFNTIYENMENTKYHFHVVYGDTDSIMVSMDLANSDGIRYQDLEMRKRYINMGNLGSDIINEFLPPPENLEYEKILTPFTILSKKRYVGNLYEQDPKKFYQKNMGIVLKRRDNSRIVKFVVGGVVDKLINTLDLDKGKKEALEFAQKSLFDIIDGKYDISLFILSKSLKEKYKTKTDPSHVVLAKKMARRDPGNAPAVNDRIPYVFIVVDENKVTTQGDRVENPQYLIEHNLHIDYLYYIKKQIEIPCRQFLDLFNKEESNRIFRRAEEYFIRKQAGLKYDNNTILTTLLKNSNKNKGKDSEDSGKDSDIKKNIFSITF